MNKRILGLVSMFLILFTFAFTSCNTTDSTATDTENFVNDALDGIATETRTCNKGCYELVFPVTVVFPDATTQEVASYDEMKTAFITWKENNPDVKGRPTIQFPFSITTTDGSIVEITTKEDLATIIAACKPVGGGGPGHGGPGHGGPKGGHGKACFELVFPVTVTTSTGEVTLADNVALKALLKSLKGSGERPVFVFPINVILSDGTTQAVNSAEELHAIKEACRN